MRKSSFFKSRGWPLSNFWVNFVNGFEKFDKWQKKCVSLSSFFSNKSDRIDLFNLKLFSKFIVFYWQIHALVNIRSLVMITTAVWHYKINFNLSLFVYKKFTIDLFFFPDSVREVWLLKGPKIITEYTFTYPICISENCTIWRHFSIFCVFLHFLLVIIFSIPIFIMHTIVVSLSWSNDGIAYVLA